MTTYVLGAGASAHGGYPLCRDLWPRIAAWVKGSLPTDPRFAKAIAIVTELCGSVDNLESVLTDLDRGCGVFDRLAPAERTEAIGSIRECVGAYFGSICASGPTASRYEALAKKITAGDVVLTFNYDVALEAELIRVGKFRVRNGYGFDADWDEPKSDITVLKPHGSINWRGLIFEGSRGYSSHARSLGKRPFVDNSDSFFPEYPSRILDKSFSGGGVTHQAITLVLPTREKRFSVPSSSGDEWVEFYELCWSEAKKSLGQSDQMVVIGYSMPEADRRSRGAILCGSNRLAEVIVSCGGSNASLKMEFENHGFERVHERGGFADLVSNWVS